MSTIVLFPLTLALALTGQTPKATERPHDTADERLEFMKGSVKGYVFTRNDDRGAVITLRAEPAFRLGKQGDSNVLEGAIFLWTDAVGRPEAAAQVFLLRYEGRPEGVWLHEFTSLSTRALVAADGRTTQWSPVEPGVVFRPLPGAPKPGATPGQRLRQMRALAAEFRAQDDFGGKGWEALRMLPTPIARYGKAGGTPEDGALFAFVEGTDPEVFLFLEARPSDGRLVWQYAFAPMSCWPLKAERKGQVLWSVPQRNTDNPVKAFFVRAYQP